MVYSLALTIPRLTRTEASQRSALHADAVRTTEDGEVA